MWGTTATIINSISFNIFQFTPRVGERQYLNQSTHIQTYISIHATLQGATISHFPSASYFPHFNSRSLVRSDAFPFFFQGMLVYFNSRPHIESDPSSYVAVRPFVFQFTPPIQRATQSFVSLDNIGDISIHAPLWRATFYDLFYYSFAHISIHAPLEESDRFLQVPRLLHQYFNSRSHMKSNEIKKMQP